MKTREQINRKGGVNSISTRDFEMKLVGVFVFVFCLVIDVNYASVSLSSNQLTLNGNAHIRFYGPREEIWNGLSDGKIL